MYNTNDTETALQYMSIMNSQIQVMYVMFDVSFKVND